MSTKQKRLQAAATAVGKKKKGEKTHNNMRSPQLGNQSSVSYREEKGGREWEGWETEERMEIKREP